MKMKDIFFYFWQNFFFKEGDVDYYRNDVSSPGTIFIFFIILSFVSIILFCIYTPFLL